MTYLLSDGYLEEESILPFIVGPKNRQTYVGFLPRVDFTKGKFYTFLRMILKLSFYKSEDKQNCVNFFKRKFEINNKTQTFI